MITVYGCPGTRSTRVTWTLEELGLDYEHVKIDLLRGEGREPSFLEIDPAAKVPALEVDD